MKIHRFVFLLICLAPGLRAFDAANYGDGLYAVFTVSGGVSGEFAVQLHYDKVPLTVANFVALAEGSRPWIEESTGALVSEPFYDGITFHRVIAGFVIQAGSPNGLGTDGPGYSFPDEIDPALFHTQAGVLSMANSGVNTNGSQFFITLNPTTNLDGKHTVFGEVVENQSVVNTIGNTPTGGNDRPLTDVFIDSIEIVRQGTAAE
ncbi:MAG: peptidylprolyl isomerase, partial [Verrucomicrobiota bacterium]